MRYRQRKRPEPRPEKNVLTQTVLRAEVIFANAVPYMMMF